MVITVVQKRNRFFRFLDDKTSVLHNEIRYTTKFSPINWGYSSGTGNTGYWQHFRSSTNQQICIASIGKVKKLYFRQCKREMENQH